ncbi:hypothetical protein DPMN_103077 [Dreissena polymorpha]|uniref:Uncharacterized protein n=1 Tax=Dreissena polymorpha TaxID=45954 RepID=A0A9D4HDS4_DREPO|nr:hypothetical protein DPMN_103077 [Dreissena polymorpha]
MSRDLSSMPCSATPLVAIVDGSEWADKIQVISNAARAGRIDKKPMTLRRGTCHLCPARRHLSWLLLMGRSGPTRYSQSRANRQEADDAASRDLSSMPCSATPLVAIVDGSEWADKIQVINAARAGRIDKKPMTLRRGTCHLCPARRHLSWLLLMGQSGLTRYRL